MDTYDVSDVPEYLRILQGQKRTLRNAQSKKGQRPKAMKSREEILAQFMLRQMINQGPVGPHSIRSAFIPSAYPPSVLPLTDLKKIMIKDLTLETHHRGSYILLRTASQPDIMTAIMAIVEDEDNRALMLQLYNQEKEIATDCLTQGTILIVKEPYLKIMADGDCGIRVDHLSDVRFIPAYDASSTFLERTGYRRRHPCQRLEDNREQLFQQGYSKALKSAPTAEEALTIKLNRALAFLKRDQFDAALHDLKELSSTFHLSEKVLFRKAQALYHLQRFRECCDVYTEFSKQYPGLKSAKSEFNRAISRLKEEQRGDYQFKLLQREAAENRPPHLDHATYVGHVSVGSTDSHGRGLFTTQAVKAGDLLFCEKAFAYAFHDAINPIQGLSLLMNTERNTMIVGTQADLLSLIIQKLYKSPSLMSTITDLYHGSYKPVGASEVDGAPIVDTFLVERIMSLNSFGCLLSSRESHKQVTIQRPQLDKNATKFHSCGLWPLASSINHSCYSNARRSFIGDMMIVRATQDLEPNTELNFWYQSPAGSNSKNKRMDLRHWGFKCSCIICQDALNTPQSVVTKRERLQESLEKSFKSPQKPNVARVETILSTIAETYNHPASQVPRFCLWDTCLTLSLIYSTRNQPQKAIDFALKALESLGYIIEGGRPPLIQEAPLVVKKWGLAVDSLVPCWMSLANCYRKVAPGLEDQAKKYAKITYRICVGEDETFDELYAKESGNNRALNHNKKTQQQLGSGVSF
ncbi:uncharacterized protein N7498_007706 [Penicillium cinerascens]|uniref:SET domain-containing protein n=1 Tax=Penicillium cinerascens TaxID=70096 RepID=A0A9W9JLL8_9EURO|nr:uncharacterized protein N7498_007706 [Penicillium cinerascens]KAJ5198589.1 hypothetical protein N7498_007706 [Penicillium cinerascens]